MSDLYVNPRLTIASKELTVSAARSGGPGGQNVNKVNSKVTLRWSPKASENFPVDWRGRFLSRFANRINRDGEFVLHSEKYRDQARNLADVRSRLVEMLLSCQAAPKIRKPTRPTSGSRRRRLEQKKQQSQKKRNRRQPRLDD